jgi:hypothetical protein
MGREATRREMSPMESGLETFKLQQAMGYHEGIYQEEAMMTAIQAAVETGRRIFIREMRDMLLYKAEELDSDEDNDLFDDGPAALLSYAKDLDEMLPFEQRLENNDS